MYGRDTAGSTMPAGYKSRSGTRAMIEYQLSGADGSAFTHADTDLLRIERGRQVVIADPNPRSRFPRKTSIGDRERKAGAGGARSGYECVPGKTWLLVPARGENLGQLPGMHDAQPVGGAGEGDVKVVEAAGGLGEDRGGIDQ